MINGVYESAIFILRPKNDGKMPTWILESIPYVTNYRCRNVALRKIRAVNDSAFKSPWTTTQLFCVIILDHNPSNLLTDSCPNSQCLFFSFRQALSPMEYYRTLERRRVWIHLWLIRVNRLNGHHLIQVQNKPVYFFSSNYCILWTSNIIYLIPNFPKGINPEMFYLFLISK